MGKFGRGSRDERGLRLLQFASINNLYICNTKFKHKASRKWTWESPNGRNKNLIDLILIDQRWKPAAVGCRSFPGADISSNHNLVICNLKLNLKKLQRSLVKIVKYDVGNLRNEGITEAFQNRLYVWGLEVRLDADINVALQQINSAITEAAIKEVGTERYKRKPWISNRTLDIADEKRIAKAMRKISVSDKRKYNFLVRKTKDSAKEDKEKWIEEQCKEIQESFIVVRTKKAFGLINKLKKEYNQNQYCER